MKPEKTAHSEQSLSEWLHAELIAAFGLETESWATEQVSRVVQRLQSEYAQEKQFCCEILWLQEMTAFTVPGRYIYIARELLQRLPSDDALAFVIAHEMAHHDLGHLDGLDAYLPTLKHLPGYLFTASVRQFQHLIGGPEREAEADICALDACLEAAFSWEKCLTVFDTLEAYAIDHRDLDMVFGLDETSETNILAKFRTWGWQRTRGYLPIRERKAQLVRLLQGDHSKSKG